jgi:hypothetical protein
MTLLRNCFIRAGCRLEEAFQTSVPVLTFAFYRGRHFYECQNQRDTSNYKFQCGFGFDIRDENSRLI